MSSNPVDDVTKFVSDKDRMKAALVTGGLSETGRFASQTVSDLSNQVLPDAPNMEKAGTPPGSSDASVLAAQAAEAARAKKGRAANILTDSSSSSLTSSSLSLSRKTLMGA